MTRDDDDQPRVLWPWLICGALLLATLLNYMDRQVLAVTFPTLKEQYHLGEARIGWLEGSFGFAFAYGSLFFGWLADKWGPRFLYPLVLAGWSLAGIATSLASQPAWTSALENASDVPGTGVFRWLLACRIALGFCEAGHWPCALLTVRAILEAKDRTLGNGILQSGASIGAVIVPLYVEASDRAGNSWAFPFWSIGVMGLTWIPIWFFLVRGRDLSKPKVAATQTEAVDPPTSQLIRRLIVLAIIVATLTISWQFLRAWLALFLQSHHGYTKESTRGLMSAYFIAADVGCLLSGVLVTRLAMRGWTVASARKLGFFIFAMLTACGALIPFVGNGALMITLLLITGAGILGLHPYYYSLTQELSTTRMGMMSGALAAGGWVVSGLSQIYLGSHIEATKSYQLGLVIVGLAPLLGLLALLLLWPRSEKNQVSP